MINLRHRLFEASTPEYTEGDDAVLFQIAQNALMGPLDDKLDIHLGGHRRGLEDGQWAVRHPMPRACCAGK